MTKRTLVKSLVLGASLATLYSCGKSKSNNVDQIATLGKATITGKVTGRTVDTAGAQVKQAVPAGTTINAWIDTRDFVLNSAYASGYGHKYYSATTDAAGNYTLTVDVSPYQAATVHVEPAPFEYNVVKNTMGVINRDSIYTERKVFTSTPVMISVSKDLKEFSDFSYN